MTSCNERKPSDGEFLRIRISMDYQMLNIRKRLIPRRYVKRIQNYQGCNILEYDFHIIIPAVSFTFLSQKHVPNAYTHRIVKFHIIGLEILMMRK